MKNVKAWAKAAGVRAVKTVAQTAVATVPTSAVVIGDDDWVRIARAMAVMIAGASALAGILSILTSVAGIPEVDDGENVAAIAKHAKTDE